RRDPRGDLPAEDRCRVRGEHLADALVLEHDERVIGGPSLLRLARRSAHAPLRPLLPRELAIPHQPARSRASRIHPRTCRTRASSSSHAPFATMSFVMSFDPIPAATIPARNHSRRLSGSGATPPVGSIEVHGRGPSTARTNSGPPIESPGKILTISEPSSSAVAISVTVPQPGA